MENSVAEPTLTRLSSSNEITADFRGYTFADPDNINNDLTVTLTATNGYGADHAVQFNFVITVYSCNLASQDSVLLWAEDGTSI